MPDANVSHYAIVAAVIFKHFIPRETSGFQDTSAIKSLELHRNGRYFPLLFGSHRYAAVHIFRTAG